MPQVLNGMPSHVYYLTRQPNVICVPVVQWCDPPQSLRVQLPGGQIARLQPGAYHLTRKAAAQAGLELAELTLKETLEHYARLERILRERVDAMKQLVEEAP